MQSLEQAVKRSMTIFTVFLFTSVVTIAHGIAATSEWSDLGGGKARLVADFDPSAGKLNAAIEVKLDDGWATYWRYPGYTGIPPLFDFSASSNLSFGDIGFPTPSLQTSGDARYAGYKNSVIFPFSADVSANQLPTLKLDMLIGVCEEICIPAKANFTISPEQLVQSDPIAKRVLTLAKLNMPKKMSGSETSLKMKRLSPALLEISLETPTNGNEEQFLFVEGPTEWYLKPAEFQKQVNGRSVFHLDVTNLPAETSVSQDQIQLTFVSGTQGFEIRD